MDSSVSGKDEIWFLRVCHQVPHELYSEYRGIQGPKHLPLESNVKFQQNPYTAVVN